MSIKRTVNGGFNPTSNNLSRRDILILSAGAVAVSTSAFTPMALAADETTHHGLSAFGDLAYPADFKHLKYVNANAPKGGTFSQLAGGGTATFNSFNGFILKGDPAIDMEQAFAALMWRAADEPDAVYAYAADQGHGVGRRPRLQIPPARRHHLPRRQPDQGRGRRLLADDAEDQGPPRHRQPAARHGGRRSRRRPHRRGALYAEPGAQRAAHRRQPADPVQGLLHGAPLRRDLDGAAARLRPLQGRQVRAGPLRGIRTRQGLVGRQPADHPRSVQFRRAAL